MPDRRDRNTDLEHTVKALQVLERQHDEASYTQVRDRLVEKVLRAYQQEGRELAVDQARAAVEQVLGPDPATPAPPPRRWYHNPAMVFWVVAVLLLSIPAARLLARLLGLLFRL